MSKALENKQDGKAKRSTQSSWWSMLRTEQRPLSLPRPVAIGLGVLALVVALVLPMISPTYVNFDLSLVMVYAVAGLGLNMLTGNTGQISLGHSAFFALGAYAAAICAVNEVPLLAAFPVAALLCFVVGYLIGLPALRLRGLQLALVTLALALTVPSLIKRFAPWTGGNEGLNVLVAMAPEWSGLADDQWRYFICLITLIIGLVIAHRVTKGRTGRSLIAIRDNELAATAMGIRASRVKTSIFALSAAYAGIAGVLYTIVVQFVGPEAFGLHLAIVLVTLIVVGGRGALPASILGGLFVVYVPKFTGEINQSASDVVYGAVLILFMFVLPFGLVGLVRALGHRFRKPAAAGHGSKAAVENSN